MVRTMSQEERHNTEGKKQEGKKTQKPLASSRGFHSTDSGAKSKSLSPGNTWSSLWREKFEASASFDVLLGNETVFDVTKFRANSHTGGWRVRRLGGIHHANIYNIHQRIWVWKNNSDFRIIPWIHGCKSKWSPWQLTQMKLNWLVRMLENIK